MLRLSKKVDYAIILLVHLGRVSKPVSAQEIASHYLLPQPMVANILKQLSSAGMIESKRGQQGGYCLDQSPDRITLSDIIQVIDGSFTLVECVRSRDDCKVQESCPTQNSLLALHSKLEGFMTSITLRELIEPQTELCL